MENKKTLEEVVVYSVGIVCCSACAPKSLSTKEVEEQVNEMEPTGISSDWHISPDPTFAAGGPNPSPCEKDPARIHYLLNC